MRLQEEDCKKIANASWRSFCRTTSPTAAKSFPRFSIHVDLQVESRPFAQGLNSRVLLLCLTWPKGEGKAAKGNTWQSRRNTARNQVTSRKNTGHEEAKAAGL